MERRDLRDIGLITLASRSLVVSTRLVIVVFLCDSFIQLHHHSILFDKLIVLPFVPFVSRSWLWRYYVQRIELFVPEG